MNPQHSPAGVRSRPPLILRAASGCGGGTSESHRPGSTAVASVTGPGPFATSQRTTPVPQLKLLSTRWQEASWAVRISRRRSRVGIVSRPPLAATWLPRPAIDGCRRPSGAGLDGWVGRSALTGWTAGAHVPAIQLPSLPLDEWHYMRHNEAGRVRLRTARIGTPRWRTAARRPAGPICRRRPQGRSSGPRGGRQARRRRPGRMSTWATRISSSTCKPQAPRSRGSEGYERPARRSIGHG
jgi:hypothetical protein